MKLSPTDAETIAEFCKLVRNREDKSMREFADRFEVGYAYISQVENGKVDMPMSYLKKIKRFCNDRELNYLLALINDAIKKQLL